MDRTRVAAWVAGIAAALLLLELAYVARATLDPRAAAWRLFGISVPLAVPFALFAPSRPLARAVFAAGATAAAVGTILALSFLFDPRSRSLLAAIPAYVYVGWLLPFLTASAAIAWAIRPTRNVTLLTRIVFGAQAAVAIALLLGHALEVSASSDLNEAGMFEQLLRLIPAAAVAVGLSSREPARSTDA